MVKTAIIFFDVLGYVCAHRSYILRYLHDSTSRDTSVSGVRVVSLFGKNLCDIQIYADLISE